MMRTTVSLDDDVAAAVDRLRRERGLGLSEAVNELVRQGLLGSSTREPYEHRTADVGITVDVSNVGDVLDVLDDA